MYNQETINYILDFIVGVQNGRTYINYDYKINENKPINIIKSKFWDDSIYGTSQSIPKRTQIIVEDGIVFLFGYNKIERGDTTTVIYADLVASAYFLLSRYDEYFGSFPRDKYNRIIGASSFKGANHILSRPIVDEYGIFIRNELKRLRIEMKIQEHKLSHVYLTHDVDRPWGNYSFTNAVKTVLKELLMYGTIDISPLINALGIYCINRCDSFDWILRQDNRFKTQYKGEAHDIYFLIGVAANTPMTMKYWNDKKAKIIVDKIRKYADVIGLHSSYEAGTGSAEVLIEKRNLEESFGLEITANRNHYLISYRDEWLQELNKCGITDDYTIGYADVVGYRLSTTKPVKWINPQDGKLYNITLHPLSVMDSTLIEMQYMNLNKNDAIALIKDIVLECKKHSGDFTFLLHNDIINDPRYVWIQEVYVEMLDFLVSI